MPGLGRPWREPVRLDLEAMPAKQCAAGQALLLDATDPNQSFVRGLRPQTAVRTLRPNLRSGTQLASGRFLPPRLRYLTQDQWYEKRILNRPETSVAHADYGVSLAGGRIPSSPTDSN